MGWLELYRDVMGEATVVDSEQEAKAILEKPVATLGEHRQQVLEMRYGLKDGRSRTFKAIGDEVGRAYATIREHYCRAMRKLRWKIEQMKEEMSANEGSDQGLKRAWPLLARDLWQLSLEELILVRSAKDEILRRFEELKGQLEA